ncbi:hypothetical protein ABFS82_04G072500 [Erythranthe guttata]|uniref:transcription factor IBH1-like n=1 Tax=Erythranthe guttata TaxID=4155 RepID=UPI00064DB0D2|nr:PREDICTED: transcription factor IBH1-like [Erythranthe guttata]|eukprot:XP_012836732.1 PREDICTED: transcription factor IBH1-like [Erythranthe guttata]
MTDHKNHQIPTAKPSSIKTRFAIKFLRAMNKLNNKNKNNKNTMSEKHKRFLAIRAAAHASMASAVGPRRAWSRAVLRKIPNQQKQLHYSLMNKQRTRRRNIRRNRILLITRGNPNRENYDHEENEDEDEEEEDLRELVPGGKEMDFCRLLNETAHYIKCLRTQVQVMTNILHHSSPSNILYK